MLPQQMQHQKRQQAGANQQTVSYLAMLALHRYTMAPVEFNHES